MILLTDAAAEEEGASLGSVFLDPATNRFRFFGKRIGERLIKKWQMDGKRQVICPAELITVPLAL